MIFKRMKSGIQRKYLKHMLALLVLALLMSSIGVWLTTYQRMKSTIVDKYAFLDEEMGIALDALFQKSDEVLAECIINTDVQNSLRIKKLEEVEKTTISKYFAYIDMENVSEYCYVDNKKNVYTRSYSKIDYEDFKNSKLAARLGKSYATTKWFLAPDNLFGDGEEALFIGRYVHSMEYAHEPGMLFLKMSPKFLEEVLGRNTDSISEAAVGIMDEKGNIWKSWHPGGYEMPDSDTKLIREMAKEDVSGMICQGEKIDSGLLSAYRQNETGLIVYTIVTDSVISQDMGKTLLILGGIYLMVAVVAINLSIYFSKRFAKPIKMISEEMTSFDGNDFSRKIELNTNTELDQIGKSYNQMLRNIENLLEEIKMQEKELRTSEMNMLISQINPHFMYNTLDTIYMLARINGEETSMRMIQALSKYLRLSLSKGNDIVTVEDELENMKSYMEIQQIRNENLFDFRIDCQVDAKNTWILKLILQPLVENSIKYGFCEIYKGGEIHILIKEIESMLCVEVWNNGKPIDEKMAMKINALNGAPLRAIKECFPDKKHGYGVTNVMTRLRLKYGEDVRFEYRAEENGTRCIIRIPDDGKENKEF